MRSQLDAEPRQRVMLDAQARDAAHCLLASARDSHRPAQPPMASNSTVPLDTLVANVYVAAADRTAEEQLEALSQGLAVPPVAAKQEPQMFRGPPLPSAGLALIVDVLQEIATSPPGSMPTVVYRAALVWHVVVCAVTSCSCHYRYVRQTPSSCVVQAEARDAIADDGVGKMVRGLLGNVRELIEHQAGEDLSMVVREAAAMLDTDAPFAAAQLRESGSGSALVCAPPAGPCA